MMKWKKRRRKVGKEQSVICQPPFPRKNTQQKQTNKKHPEKTHQKTKQNKNQEQLQQNKHTNKRTVTLFKAVQQSIKLKGNKFNTHTMLRKKKKTLILTTKYIFYL